MVNDDCHPVSPRAKARALVVDRLLVERVATWCGVTPNAVWQMLQRASDEAPFPPSRVLDVWLGAYRAGISFDLAALWPPYAEMRPAREAAR